MVRSASNFFSQLWHATGRKGTHGFGQQVRALNFKRSSSQSTTA